MEQKSNKVGIIIYKISEDSDTHHITIVDEERWNNIKSLEKDEEWEENVLLCLIPSSEDESKVPWINAVRVLKSFIEPYLKGKLLKEYKAKANDVLDISDLGTVEIIGFLNLAFVEH